MSSLVWPLQSNRIRNDVPNNAYGAKVRNNHSRDHQGWDLIAAPMSACYAIGDGEIELVDTEKNYGLRVFLAFEFRGVPHVAMYAHLSLANGLGRGSSIKQGDIVGYTGRSGNASKIAPGDAHLHFEIQTGMFPGAGMTGRINPADLYGRAPIGYTVLEAHGQKLLKATAPGLKLSAADMRKW